MCTTLFVPDTPLYAVGSAEEMARQTVADKSTVLALLAVSAGIAFALAIIGVYGVMAQTVRAQMRSYRIRLALGANRGQVLGSVIVSAVSMAVVGIGVGGALPTTRALQGQLYGIPPVHAGIYSGVAALLAMSAIAATAGPAWRAIKADPATVFRNGEQFRGQSFSAKCKIDTIQAMSGRL